ncbi:MAG TPA: glycoside hydrolase family 3 C-terminal domain-containing protein [Phycisphaerae bacterium]|mgnify:CR=1 FL=1|nr:glycoside hydrolase family 3 C-terminal domain-containing protein [Phycisphaerae bacterium]
MKLFRGRAGSDRWFVGFGVLMPMMCVSFVRAQEAPEAAGLASTVAESRIDALIDRMTLEEKTTFLYGESGMSLRAIPRLGIPSLKLADGPLGLVGSPATAFPASIALAASWDLDLASQFGAAMAREWTNKGRHMWLGPAFNIIRLPQNGRNFEYYSEDPFLASRFAVSVIRAAQANGVIACAKHYVANNQEHDRFNVNSEVDERTLREIYLPAFEAAVKEGGVYSVMCAYNKLNGPWCSNSAWLLQQVLKDEWGFRGFVVSDWGAVHETIGPANHGLDLEMDTATPTGVFWGHGKLLEAVKSGKVTEAAIDEKLRRILRVMIAAGVMERRGEAEDVDLVEHRALARKIAAEGIVLLKNDDNLLPLDRKAVSTIAVLGPNHAVARMGGGGSSHVASRYSVSPLDGIRNVGGASVNVVGVAGVLSADQYPPTPAAWLSTPSGESGGLKAEYFNNMKLEGEPVLTRKDATVDFHWGNAAPAPEVSADRFSVRWTGRLTVPTGGDWEIGLASDDGSRLYINGERVIDEWYDHGNRMVSIRRKLTANEPVDIRIEYYENGVDANAVFVCHQDDFNDAVRAAKASDVAVVFVGLDASREGEGFDRASIDLTSSELALIKAVRAAQPKTIVVIVAGSQVGFDPWLDEIPAVVQAWYGGQEAGNAIADVLFGDVNPSGRLPMTFVRKWADHPAARTYPNGKYTEGLNVGYRYFDSAEVEPAFPFGFGLGYTTFAYSDLSIDRTSLAKDGKVIVSFEVRNVGERSGKETPQVYVRDVESSAPRPRKELKGFAKVDLAPGASRRVSITLDSRSFAFYDGAAHAWRVEPGRFEILIGASASDIRLKGAFQHP